MQIVSGAWTLEAVAWNVKYLLDTKSGMPVHLHHTKTPWCPFPLQTMSTTNLKLLTNLYFSSGSLLILTFITHTLLFSIPTFLLPYHPLAAPGSILVSLLLQLMKAKVLAKSSGFHHYFLILYALWQTADMSEVGVTLFSPC